MRHAVDKESKDQLQPLLWLGRDRERFAEFFAAEMPQAEAGMPAEVCTGPIAYRHDGCTERGIDDLQHAAARAKPLETFMTVVAPVSTAYNGVNEYYGSEHDYVFALAGARRELF